jgi:hypothetical protein
VLPKTNSGKHKVKINGLIVGEVSGWLLNEEQVGSQLPQPALHAVLAALVLAMGMWGEG